VTASAFLSRFTSSGPAVLVLLALAGAGTAATHVVARRHGRVGVVWPVLLADSVLLIALLTLLPVSGGGQAVNWHLGASLDLESAANVALYVPAGFCLARVVTDIRARAGALLALALLAPATVEVLQNSLSLGRISDVNDVAANALGAVLGFASSAASWTRGPRPVVELVDEVMGS